MASIIIWSVISFAAGYLLAWNIHHRHRDAKGRFTKTGD
jgi:membrane protein DedA with SNARE-associated domain